MPQASVFLLSFGYMLNVGGWCVDIRHQRNNLKDENLNEYLYAKILKNDLTGWAWVVRLDFASTLP
jgi:hypothetical protein